MDALPAPQDNQRFCDGRDITNRESFAAAYAEFFAPLTQWEFDHGPWTPILNKVADLWRLVGIPEGQHFPGHDHTSVEMRLGVWYVVVVLHEMSVSHTISSRTAGADCPCDGCFIEFVVPKMTNYSHMDDGFGEVMVWFIVPDSSVDALELSRVLNPLHKQRCEIEAGRKPPWSIFTARYIAAMNHGFRLTELARTRQALDSAQADLDADVEALAMHQIPAERPANRLRRARSPYNGKPLKRLQAVPGAPTWAVADGRHEKAQARLRQTVEHLDDVDAALAMDLPASVVDLLTRERPLLATAMESHAQDAEVAKDDRDRYLFDIAKSIDSKRAAVERRKAEVARLERMGDPEYVTWLQGWPGPIEKLPERKGRDV